MKKLLVIAIAAAVSAPVLADTTLYGQLHASYDVLDGASGSLENTVASNSSSIGVKGSADLSNGLKAIYQAEWGVDTGGTGTTTFNNRNQVVGLAGGFGAVLIGRHDTPLKTVGRKADLFWSTQLGQNRSLVNRRYDGVAGLDLRANNVIAYQTPKMGGFQALAAYVTDVGGKDDDDVFSLNGFYKAGPLTLGAGFETRDTGVSGVTIATPGGTESDAFRLMASYKISSAKVVGFFQNQDVEDATTGAQIADADVWGLGLAYGIGAGTIKGQYYEVDDSKGTDDASLFAIGYDHKLGKKTHVYGQYAIVDNDAGSTVALGGSGHGESIGPDAGGEASGISIGIRHKF